MRFVDNHKTARISLLEILSLAAIGHVLFEWIGIDTMSVETHGALADQADPVIWAYVIIFACAIWAWGAYSKVRDKKHCYAIVLGIAINTAIMIAIFFGSVAASSGITITIFAAIFCFQLIEVGFEAILTALDNTL